MELLDLYKRVNGVDVYIYPLDIQDRIQRGEYTIKKIRSKYRCLVSENVTWRTKRRGIAYGNYYDPPVPLDQTLLVAMGRAREGHTGYEIVERLIEAEVKVNPYTSDKCFGFYTNSFNNLEEIVRDIAELTEAVAVVNTVWYMRLRRLVKLSQLVPFGFVLKSSKTFKAVSSVVNSVPVTIFYTGTVRLNCALTPAQARRVAGNIYALLLESGALA